MQGSGDLREFAARIPGEQFAQKALGGKKKDSTPHLAPGLRKFGGGRRKRRLSGQQKKRLFLVLAHTRFRSWLATKRDTEREGLNPPDNQGVKGAEKGAFGVKKKLTLLIKGSAGTKTEGMEEGSNWAKLRKRVRKKKGPSASQLVRKGSFRQKRKWGIKRSARVGRGKGGGDLCENTGEKVSDSLTKEEGGGRR